MENKKEESKKSESQATGMFGKCKVMMENCFGTEKQMTGCCSEFFKNESDAEKSSEKTT